MSGPFNGYEVFRDANKTTDGIGADIWRVPVPERPEWILWICLRPENVRETDHSVAYAVRFEKPDATSETVFATTQDQAIVRANSLYREFFKEPEPAVREPQLIPETVRAVDPRSNETIDGRPRLKLEFRLQSPFLPNERPVWFLVDAGRHGEGNRAPMRGWLLGAVWQEDSGAYGWIRYGREAGYASPDGHWAPDPELEPQTFEEACRALLAAL